MCVCLSSVQNRIIIFESFPRRRRSLCWTISFDVTVLDLYDQNSNWGTWTKKHEHNFGFFLLHFFRRFCGAHCRKPLFRWPQLSVSHFMSFPLWKCATKRMRIFLRFRLKIYNFNRRTRWNNSLPYIYIRMWSVQPHSSWLGRAISFHRFNFASVVCVSGFFFFTRLCPTAKCHVGMAMLHRKKTHKHSKYSELYGRVLPVCLKSLYDNGQIMCDTTLWWWPRAFNLLHRSYGIL